MSKIRIRDINEHPKVTTRVDLVDYHRDLKGEFLDVWMNIDREMTRALQAGRFEALQIAQLPYATEEDLDARAKRSDGLVETMKQIHVRWFNLTREEIDYLYEVDTNLYHWLVDRANDAQTEYDEDRKNAGRGSSDS